MKIGLFFGSFDPIHKAHLKVGAAAQAQMKLAKVWFMLTPTSPAKQVQLPAADRLLLLRLALWRHPHLQAIDVELRLPAPQYTAHTLRWLSEHYPKYRFFLLMGADLLPQLHTWKDISWLMAQYPICIYGRKNHSTELPLQVLSSNTALHYIKGPLFPISSTQLRATLRAGQIPTQSLPPAVLQCIEKRGFYR